MEDVRALPLTKVSGQCPYKFFDLIGINILIEMNIKSILGVGYTVVLEIDVKANIIT
ncbi:MAG: hypothetical protein H6567_04995 [Lewinellaceae bacterium]|nr:hypothetical protein [Lewinellaceae bacterium]